MKEERSEKLNLQGRVVSRVLVKLLSRQMQARKQREGARLGVRTCYWDLDKGVLREAESRAGSVANVSTRTEPAAGLLA